MSISSFVLRTQRTVQKPDEMLARANSFCLLAVSRSDRRVLALLLVVVERAVLCCAVLAGQRKQRHSGRFPNKTLSSENTG